MKKGVFGFLGLVLMCSVPGLAYADPEPRLSQFSGKPVPRFESLRYSTVNGRIGPSLDHPIAWRYERAGLPMLILKESMDWRRVRDPEGAEVWVHARMLSSKSTGFISRDATVKRQVTSEADDVAVFQAGVIVDILARDHAWVKVRKDKVTGWVEQDVIWGQSTPYLTKEISN